MLVSFALHHFSISPPLSAGPLVGRRKAWSRRPLRSAAVRHSAVGHAYTPRPALLLLPSPRATPPAPRGGGGRPAFPPPSTGPRPPAPRLRRRPARPIPRRRPTRTPRSRDAPPPIRSPP